jgi:hypothetical protein
MQFVPADEVIRDIALKEFGDLTATKEAADFAKKLTTSPLAESPGQGELARLAGGDWTPVEWANACGLTTLKMTGDEMRSLFIASWVRRD